MLKKIACSACAGLLLLSAPAHAEPTGFRSYQLAKHGSLQLSVPNSWNDQMRQRQPDSPPTILFTPERGYGFNVQVTPLWLAKQDAKLPAMEELKTVISSAADDAKPHAVESEIPIREIQGASGAGYYFTLTDHAPKSGEFKFMTQGMLRVGKVMLAFTILSNDSTESAVADALIMLRGARQSEAAPH